MLAGLTRMSFSTGSMRHAARMAALSGGSGRGARASFRSKYLTSEPCVTKFTCVKNLAVHDHHLTPCDPQAPPIGVGSRRWP